MGDGPSSIGDSFWDDIDDAEAIGRYDLLVNAVDEGVYQLDADGCFVGVNDMIVEITGYRREELLGSHASLVLNEPDIQRIKQNFRRRLTTGDDDRKVATYETTLETVDGTTLICELRISLLISDATFHGSIGIVRDVTERRQCECHIQAELEAVVDRITTGFFAPDTDWNITHEQFAYAASHDLHEPLRMVSSYRQLIEDRFPDELDEMRLSSLSTRSMVPNE